MIDETALITGLRYPPLATRLMCKIDQTATSVGASAALDGIPCKHIRLPCITCMDQESFNHRSWIQFCLALAEMGVLHHVSCVLAYY